MDWKGQTSVLKSNNVFILFEEEKKKKKYSFVVMAKAMRILRLLYSSILFMFNAYQKTYGMVFLIFFKSFIFCYIVIIIQICK